MAKSALELRMRMMNNCFPEKIHKRLDYNQCSFLYHEYEKIEKGGSDKLLLSHIYWGDGNKELLLGRQS